VLIHACDVGSFAYDFDHYLNWALLISQEFNDVTVAEARENLPVTGFKKFSSWTGFLKGQVGFCNFMIVPLWNELGNFFPELSVCNDNIQANVARLKEEIKKATQPTEQESNNNGSQKKSS